MCMSNHVYGIVVLRDDAGKGRLIPGKIVAPSEAHSGELCAPDSAETRPYEAMRPGSAIIMSLSSGLMPSRAAAFLDGLLSSLGGEPAADIGGVMVVVVVSVAGKELVWNPIRRHVAKPGGVVQLILLQPF